VINSDKISSCADLINYIKDLYEELKKINEAKKGEEKKAEETKGEDKKA
jgi:hypothetical protein